MEHSDKKAATAPLLPARENHNKVKLRDINFTPSMANLP